MTPRIARVDRNHAAIVDAFRRLGWSVQSLATIGKGCPDLVIAKPHVTALVEVKAAKGKLTEDQVQWLARWSGPVYVVRTLEDVVAVTRELLRQEAA